jgi:nucleotide-binding universal stress UspA family protein
MAKRVLIPMDSSEQAWEACEFAMDEFGDAELVLLHVIDPAEAGYSAQASIPSFSEEWFEQAKSRAESLFENVREEATPRGVTVESEVVVGRPAREIVDYADENDIDHVVMGSHGRSGVSRIVLGSVAENVVRKSSVPVTVAR